MCLIIDRPEGIEIDPSLLDSGLDDNPDGWGIMHPHDGSIKVIRGMTAKPFRKALRRIGGRDCTIHFRWATHGKTNVSNCHPFSFGSGRYALMHNGIISGLETIDPGKSDTWHFARSVLAPALASDPTLFETSGFHDAIAKAIGTSNKLVILRSDGAKLIVNRDAGIDHNGLWLSNGNSLPVPMRRGSPRFRDLIELDGSGDRIDGYSDWDRSTWIDPYCLEDMIDSDFETVRALCEDDPDLIAGLILDHLSALKLRHAR